MWEEWRDMLGCDEERIGLFGRSGEICKDVMGRGLGCVGGVEIYVCL